MIEFAERFVGTLLLRPYVFAFLGAFLLIARTQMGWRRTLLWIVTGYTIAFASEFSSIHNGFPYGVYEYLPEGFVDRELWVCGVPFMDSLSYVFLSHVAFLMAIHFRSSVHRRGRWDYEVRSTDRIRRGALTALLSAYLFMTLDVVIDPVAHLGDRWFLGRIYRYVEPGIYFDVPLSNFAGWFLVGLTIVGVNQILDGWLSRRGSPLRPSLPFPGRDAFVPALYFSILLFNIAVTFAIGETRLGLVGFFVSLPLLVLYLVCVPGRAIPSEGKTT